MRLRILALLGALLFATAASADTDAQKLGTVRQMIDAWNTAGLDYATFGNHEFDFGPDVLKERMKESKFGWLLQT